MPTNPFITAAATPYPRFPEGTLFFLWVDSNANTYRREGPEYYHIILPPHSPALRIERCAGAPNHQFLLNESGYSVEDFHREFVESGRWAEVTADAFRWFLHSPMDQNPRAVIHPSAFVRSGIPLRLPPTNHKLGAPKGRLP